MAVASGLIGGSPKDFGEPRHQKGEKPHGSGGRRTHGAGRREDALKKAGFGEVDKEFNVVTQRKLFALLFCVLSLLLGFQPISKISTSLLPFQTLLQQSREMTYRRDEFCIHSVNTVE